MLKTTQKNLNDYYKKVKGLQKLRVSVNSDAYDNVSIIAINPPRFTSDPYFSRGKRIEKGTFLLTINELSEMLKNEDIQLSVFLDGTELLNHAIYSKSFSAFLSQVKEVLEINKDFFD